MTDLELIDLLKSDTPLNRARQQFSFGCGRIEQAQSQRTPLGPIDVRRMEFEVVRKIAKELGIEI